MSVVAAKPREASKPAPEQKPAPPLIGDTGNAKVDAIADVINRAAEPFQNAPDPAKGTLGQIEHGIGAVMGVVGAPFELLDTGFAMATSFIAELLPGFPAATLLSPHVGTPHAHLHPLSLTPPNPVPVPLPSIGMLTIPGAVNVLIAGMPAARAGDIGMAPTCVGLFPLFDVFTGSSNTWIAGSRAARMGDITWHCNIASAANVIGMAMGAIGVIAGAVGAGAAASAGQAAAASAAAAQTAADAVALAASAFLGKDPGIPPTIGAIMSGVPNVLIGGFPMPDVLAALGGLAKAAKKAGKAIGKSKGFGKVIKKVGLCNDPGEPVSPFTGEVYNDFEDYVAFDTGLHWERHYRSGWNQQDGPLGYGHRHFFQRTLSLLRRRAVYETHDNERVGLEKLENGSYAAVDGFTLTSKDGQRFELTTDRDELLVYQRQPSTPPTGRLERYRTDKLDVYLSYDGKGRLRTLSEVLGGAAIDTYLIYNADGHIEEVRRGRRNQSPLTISRYVYFEGCIVEWHDALGGVKRFRYDAEHRMLQGTDRRGYSFHWHYDPNNGRCIKSHGDDGLWGIEASYQGLTSTFTEPDGGEWTFKHYANGGVSHIIRPDGTFTRYVQDDAGRVVQQIMPGGTAYVWTYDASGRQIGRIDHLGHLVPPEDEDPNPHPLAHDGPVTSEGYLCGRPAERMERAVARLPGSIRAEFLGTSIAAGSSVPASRDALGRIIEQHESDGSVRTFAYDAESNPVEDCMVPVGAAPRPSEPGARDRGTTREYRSWNLLARDTSPLGNSTRYEHTHRGEWRSVEDAAGNRTNYGRDKLHRVSEIHRYGGLYRRYRHDASGAVIEEQDGEGKTLVKHKVGRDGLYKSSKLASGETYTYAHDARGMVLLASSSEHEIRQRHKGAQRTLDERDGQGVDHLYRDDSRLVRTRYFQRFVVTYKHARDSRLRIATPDGTEHVLWRDAEAHVRENGNGTCEAMAFDAHSRLRLRACWRRNEPTHGAFWTTSYRYNAAGELLYSTDGDQRVQQYEYDADHRLTAQRDHRGVRPYSYDRAGNLTRTPGHALLEYLDGNLLRHADFEHFYYDARRRLARRDRPGGSVVDYLYDSLDQLVEVRFSDRPKVWRASYDGLGRRLWRDYGGQRTDFYWDGDRLSAERFPDARLRIYVYPNEDALVPFMWIDFASEDADPTSGVAFYLYTAPTGMPLRVEDAYGAEVWSATGIDAYGEFDESVPPCPTRLRFAGHFYDEHLGLFYNRFRDYDPALGRYLQPDPLGHAGGINLFAYPSNPVADVDLRGLIHRKPKKASAESEQPGKPKEQAGPVKELDVDTYAKLNKRAEVGDQIQHDHIPAFATVRDQVNRERAARKQKPLTRAQERVLADNLTTMAMADETHAGSRTYKGRNKESVRADDGKDLRAAADKDLATARENLINDGHDPKAVDSAIAKHQGMNENNGVYKKPIPSSLWGGDPVE